MSEISREDAIKRLSEMQWEIGSSSVEYWSDKGIEVKAVGKAISDMKKLEKIEKILNIANNYTRLDNGWDYMFKIEQIVKEVEE